MLNTDGFFLGLLLNGKLDGSRGAYELARVSEKFRPLAERLLATPPNERQTVWDDFLTGRLWPRVVIDAATKPDEQAVPARHSELKMSLNPLLPLPITPDETEKEPRRRVRLTCAVEMKPRDVDWLWAGRVPLGMITMFAGDPKLGKSYVTLALAAAVSRGLPLPLSDLPSQPGSVILMSAEDDAARTIIPRLTAADADLVKVHILESVILADGTETLPSLRADVDAITSAAARLGDCRLIVVDPVSAYLKGVDDNRNAALREVLTPLKTLAERLGAAVVLVSHLTKRGSANGKHRVLGSIAYVGACRANHLFVADPHDATGRRVLMLDNGGNVAAPAPTLAYMIDDRGNGARVKWIDEPVTIDAGEPFGLRQEIAKEGATDAQECDQWLSAFLRNAPKPSIEVFRAAVGAGYSRDQVKRAKHRIGALAHRHGFHKGAQWIWLFPTDVAS